MQTQQSEFKKQALRLLAKRDYSRKELRFKLEAWIRQIKRIKSCKNPSSLSCSAEHLTNTEKYWQSALDGALNELELKGWLDDNRALNSIIRCNMEKYGARRLQQNLQRKGISKTAIAQSLQNLQNNHATNEIARAYEIWKRRFHSHTPSDSRDYARCLRFF